MTIPQNQDGISFFSETCRAGFGLETLALRVHSPSSGDLMRLAISSAGEALDSSVDPRFGRTRFFIVFEPETGAATAVSNSVNLNATQGAGIQAARTIINLGVKVLITGHVGPKAFAALKAGGITIYPVATGTVAEALEHFNSGFLNAMQAADVEGYR